MNLWIIVAIIISLLVIAGITMTALTIADEQKTETTQCKTCENSCAAENNCGLATCGAVSGGSCGCGK